jgi:hypothetical protein
MVTAWRDKEALEVGDDAIEEIEAGIDSADFFLFLLSPRATASKWCRRELGRADTLGKPILPLLVEEVGAREMPLQLQDKQWLDFRVGVLAGLPVLLQQLGVLDQKIAEVREDPLTRDAGRIPALAQAMYHMGRGIGLESYRGGLQLMIQNLGRAVLETPRARRLMDNIT